MKRAFAPQAPCWPLRRYSVCLRPRRLRPRFTVVETDDAGKFVPAHLQQN
jgi:hypothetical protein